MGLPDTPKKKRWPWVVAGLVVFCGLPLGGCIGLVAFGVSELSERSEEIESTVEDFFTAVETGDQARLENLADGQAPCMPASTLADAVSAIGPDAVWTADSTSFVERTGNTTLSSNADPESFFLDGRPNESAASVTGQLTTGSGTQEIQVLLSRPVTLWRICTVTVR